MSRRLGAKKTTMFDIGGATAVKHHPFFEGIDWAKLIALQVEPPLKPELGSTTDTSNFCLDFVQMALPRSLSEDSVASTPGNLGTRVGGAVPEMFRGFSFVADSFVDDENWRLHRGQSCSPSAETTDWPAESCNDDGVTGTRTEDSGSTGLTRTKKVKGKRVRNKKGKAKGLHPVGVVEGKSSPSEIRAEDVQDATLAATASATSNMTNAWGASRRLPAEPVTVMESRPSALAFMLAEQNKEHPRKTAPPPATPRRANVWGATDLPAPAPVPIPADPPRSHMRYPIGGGAFVRERRPAKNAMAMPGRRSDGDTFVWKSPI